ncbi:MAG TPA: DUF2892 domain-containing protein [Thermoanaerobaculia bacterium]|nr:DUF2892 domain-containing protein [Thermoanaerobaculia bacterium]
MSTRLFSKNVHPAERIVRIALGLGLLSLVFFGPQTLWGLVGLIPLATGFAGSCPLYSVFGFSTCPIQKPTAPMTRT